MKRNIIALIALICLSLILCSSCGKNILDNNEELLSFFDSQLNSIEDRNLSECLKNTIIYTFENGNNKELLITQNIDEMLKAIEEVEIENEVINSFKGINGFPYIKSLSIKDSEIRNLEGIEEVPALKTIYIGESNVTSFSWIYVKKCVSLHDVCVEHVSLGNNVKELAANTSVKNFYLYDCGLSDVNCFAGKKNIKILDIQDNAITDISKISDKNMNSKLRMYIEEWKSYILDYSRIKNIIENTEEFDHGTPYATPIDDTFKVEFNGKKMKFTNHTSTINRRTMKNGVEKFFSIDYVDGKQFFRQIGGQASLQKGGKKAGDSLVMKYHGKTIIMSNLQHKMKVNNSFCKSEPMIIEHGKVAYIPLKPIVRILNGSIKKYKKSSTMPIIKIRILQKS